jgi:hypothetical protein
MARNSARKFPVLRKLHSGDLANLELWRRSLLKDINRRAEWLCSFGDSDTLIADLERASDALRELGDSIDKERG